MNALAVGGVSMAVGGCVCVWKAATYTWVCTQGHAMATGMTACICMLPFGVGRREYERRVRHR